MIAIVRWLQWIALALWLGGVVGIGALSAPATFHVIRADPATAHLGAPQQNALAGQIVGASLRMFNGLCVALAVVLVAGLVVPGSLERGPRAKAEILLVVLLTASLYVLMHVLFPGLDAARAAGRMAEFDNLHHLYVDIANVQMVLLIFLAAVFVGRPVTGSAN